MLLAQDTMLLFTLLTDSDRPFNFVLPYTWSKGTGKWNEITSQEEICVHIVVFILSNWSHFYYHWKELTNL